MFGLTFWTVALLAVGGGVIYVDLGAGSQKPVLCSTFEIGCLQYSTGGGVDKGFENVLEAYKKHFTDGHEIGSSLSCYVDGQKVIDLYGGTHGPNGANDTKEIPYTSESLNMVFSSSKAMSAIVVAMLVDRDLLHYEEPIASYWPAFAKKDKGKITVANLLRHESGLSSGKELFGEDGWTFLEDREVRQKRMQDKGVDWIYPETGKTRGYHAVTRGFYISELLQRVDPKGRSLKQFVQEEIATPLGVDFYFGFGSVDEEKINRRFSPVIALPIHDTVFRVIIPALLSDYNIPYVKKVPAVLQHTMKSYASDSGDSLMSRTFFENGIPGGMTDYPHNWNDKRLLAAEIGSANAVTNAKSMAKIAMLMSNGGELDGVRLISPETWKKSHEILSDEPKYDINLGISTIFTTGGFGELSSFAPDIDYGENVFGWAGNGGSYFVWIPSKKASFAYVPNLLNDLAGRAPRLLKTFLECLNDK